jgi:hypothetical protein
MRWIAVLLIGGSLFVTGCGSSSSHEVEPGKPVSWLKGHATVVPIHSALVFLDKSFSPEQLSALEKVLGKPIVNHSVFLAPKRFKALCDTGNLPASVCP